MADPIEQAIHAAHLAVSEGCAEDNCPGPDDCCRALAEAVWPLAEAAALERAEEALRAKSADIERASRQSAAAPIRRDLLTTQVATHEAADLVASLRTKEGERDEPRPTDTATKETTE